MKVRLLTLGRALVGAATLLVGLALPGRVLANPLQGASSGATGCAPKDVTISEVSGGFAGTSWVATCRGRSFQCSSYGGPGANVNCTPRAGSEAPAAAAATAAPPEERARVKRTFDEARSAAGVLGTFSFDNNVSVAIAGAPAIRMGTLQVQLTTPGASSCSQLALVINGQKVPASELKSSRTGYKLQLNAFVPFAELKPLAKRFPSFALALCEREIEFSEAQVAELQKLLVIYSELAQEEQAKQTAQATPTDGAAKPSEAPAAAAAPAP